MINFIKRHKVLCLVVFLNVIAFLVAILMIVMHNAKTATIDIKVAPSEAIIKLNGVKYNNFESYNITPGEYQVDISMDGMRTKNFSVNIEDGELERIWTYLLDENDSFSYYVYHPEDAVLLSDLADDQAKAFIEDYNRVQGIQEQLPLTYSNTFDQEATEIISINIRWGEEGECKEKPYCLVVNDYTGKNGEKVMSMIREAGYNPEDFEIIMRTGDE